MRSRVLLALAVLGCGCAVSSSSLTTGYDPPCQDEERRVYSAWLNLLEAQHEIVVVEEHSFRPPRSCYPSEDSFRAWSFNGRATKVHRWTLADFKWANRASAAV
jgi:hypothetical protein